METIYLLDLILTIGLVTLFGWICALFSHLLDYCMWQGSIFANYLPWLSKALLKFFQPLEYGECVNLPEPTRSHEIMRRAENIFFFKILGGCVICTNVWITLFSWQIIWYFSGIHYAYLIVYTVSSSFFLRKIVKI